MTPGTTKTYTIALYDGLLVACIPDGADLELALQDEERRARATFNRDGVSTHCGLALTDEPNAEDDVVYSGYALGMLTDANGVTYEYAVRRPTQSGATL